MTMAKRALAVASLLALAGCEDEVVVSPQAPTAPVAPQAPGEPVPTEPTALVAPDAGVEEQRTFIEEDFVEIDVVNRDPFRIFTSVIAPTADDRPQVSRDVKMPETSIDDMRVIAIITRISPPRAMIREPSGVGYVVRPRDFIGRPETVQVGSDMPVQLQWQVARVRPNEVVLTREDPTAPDRPPLTRILPLYNEEDLEQQENLRLR
jgi:type IV pilus assembly protein PilP